MRESVNLTEQGVNKLKHLNITDQKAPNLGIIKIIMGETFELFFFFFYC